MASAVIGDTFPVESAERALGVDRRRLWHRLPDRADPGWCDPLCPKLALALPDQLAHRRRADHRGHAPAAHHPTAAAPPLRLGRHGRAGRAADGVSYGINQLDTSNLGASIAFVQVWGFLLLAIILVPVFIVVERRAKDPVLHLSLFSQRQMALVDVYAALSGLAEAAVVFVPALLVAAFAVPESTASFMLLPVVLVMAIGSPRPAAHSTAPVRGPWCSLAQACSPPDSC